MAYIGNTPQQKFLQRYFYTATAGQTTFSGADNNGVTLGYEDSRYIDVYLNGVKLKETDDYTATTRTSVVLTTGATLNDVLEIIVQGIFSAADTVSASRGGQYQGRINVNSSLVVTNDLKANSGYGSAATMYGVRAWMNANGVGTVSIRRSENISSLTDHGIGDYTINFTTAFPDANYSLSGACNQDINGWGQVEFSGVSPAITTMDTSAVRIRTIGYTTYGDYSHVTVMVVR